jgi:hypothetical protein
VAGGLYEVDHFSDAGLADAMRKQLRFDVLSGREVPAIQQLIVEALARLLERGAHPVPGRVQKEGGLTVVEGR